MPFKINISDKGKTYKLESESEVVVGKKIGETIKGEDIASNLEGYEIEITGISDIAGLPGFKGLEGTQYHRRLLTRGPGMHNTKKGLRLRKTNRGEEISLKISQINTKVIKQGKTKFVDLLSPKEEAPKTEEAETPAPAEEKKEEKPAPAEEPKEKNKPADETPKSAEEKPKEEPKPEEKPKEISK